MKIFRTIRQKMIDSQQLRKYLIYALGEIVLVVTGILIALAINNKNLEVSKRKKEQVYLSGLKEEFQVSRTKLDALIEVNRRSYDGARQLLQLRDIPDNPDAEVHFSELAYHSFANDVSFNPNNSLLMEMISSGSLKDIRNADLRRKLTNWTATLDNIRKQEEELEVQREKVLDMFRTDNRSVRTIVESMGMNEVLGLPAAPETISNLGLLESREFENNTILFALTAIATETEHYVPLSNNLDLILDLIEAEIRP